ncbi:hypothetical protein TNCV_1904791 [Trichonephila clavipes]|nr:hypothetical protein TNCV_1904791 [Trichonephila clavipes]
MHTFCDASSSSYACVVYLRTEGKYGVNIQLLQAKSGVAPLRKTTVPRIELLHWCSSSLFNEGSNGVRRCVKFLLDRFDDYSLLD